MRAWKLTSSLFFYYNIVFKIFDRFWIPSLQVIVKSVELRYCVWHSNIHELLYNRKMGLIFFSLSTITFYVTTWSNVKLRLDIFRKMPCTKSMLWAYRLDDTMVFVWNDDRLLVVRYDVLKFCHEPIPWIIVLRVNNDHHNRILLVVTILCCANNERTFVFIFKKVSPIAMTFFIALNPSIHSPSATKRYLNFWSSSTTKFNILIICK